MRGGHVPFVQANLLKLVEDDQELIDGWRTRLQGAGVWANDPVPLFPYPGSPDYRRLWGAPDDQAWERAVDHYIDTFAAMSELQDSRPAPTWGARVGGLRMRGVGRERRLLMTTDAVGGVWTYSLELAAGLAEHGFRTLLAVQGPAPSRAQAQEASAIPGVELVSTGLDLEWRDRRGPDTGEAREVLGRMAKHFGADLVHVNGFSRSSAWLGRSGRPSWPTPRYGAWWRACRGTEPPIGWRPYINGVRDGLAAADRIVVPGRAFRFQLEQLYAVQAKARVVQNGRSLPPAPPHDAPRRPVVLAAGRVWDEAKNMAALERMAPYLACRVVIAGAYDERERAPSVRYLGAVEPCALRREMETAAIFCAPARYEPFGLAVLEAAAAGCALVLSDIPTLREVWQGAAIFVPLHDDEQLGRALNELAQASGMRRRLAAQAQERARRFSRARMIQGYLAVYEELSRRGRGKREGGRMKVVVFCHSLASCWNHGNAHFLRGIVKELGRCGHEVRVWEDESGWSRTNLVRDHGQQALQAWRVAYPPLESELYRSTPPLDAALHGAELVLVHEWNAPWLVPGDRASTGAGCPVPRTVPRHPSPGGERAGEFRSRPARWV